MLSIGRLARGQEAYYEREAANSAEGYYAGEGEAPGRWVGRLSEALGLSGTVETGQLSRLMAGESPGTGERLRERDTKVAGLDLTWSVPKSVSLLYALGSDGVRNMIVDCHERAVDAAIRYLEDTAVLVRRGYGGTTYEHGAGVLAAAYRHRTSRAKDPHLHTHVIVANMSLGPDGRWTGVHTGIVHRAALTAGYLQEAELRANLTAELGLSWGPMLKGWAEIDGIERGVLREFSRRRAEVEAYALKEGLPLNHKGAMSESALNTRGKKTERFDAVRWRAEVVARARAHGLDDERIEEILRCGRERLERGETVNIERDLAPLFEQMASETGLTEKRNTFTERELLRSLAQHANQGAPITILREDAAVFAQRGDVLKTAERSMTVTNLTVAERRLVDAAVSRAGEGLAQLPVAVVRNVQRLLSDDQRLALEAAAFSGHGVEVIEALAGTGKTWLAGAIREVYESAGYEVIGVAPTGRARRELAEQARIPSRTLKAQMFKFDQGTGLPRGSVVILDEASLAGTRETARLLEEARAADAKVIAIGDPGQLHSVAAGGWMTAVGRRIGVVKLSEVMRQKNEEEKKMLALLHDRRPTPWMDWARKHERVSFGDANQQVARTLVQWEERTEKHSLPDVAMIARSNETREVLNQCARRVMGDRGLLGESVVYGEMELAAGDRVICRLNDRDLSVDNGTRGTVHAVDELGVTVRTDSGEDRALPAAYVGQHVEYAYALTAHGIQGGTVKTALVCALPHELTQGWSYTALSRAREETLLFVIAEGAVWKHHEEQRREEFAPGEIFDRPTEEELAKRVVHYMRTPDSEELAIEQLPGGRGGARKKIPDRDTRPEPRRRDDPDWFMAYMNPRRRSTLTEEIRGLGEQVASMPEAELKVIVDDGQALLRSMDRTAAAASNRLEREFLEHRDEAVSAERRAGEIRRQTDGLTWRHRHQREPLTAEAERLERGAERARSEMDRIELQLGRFRSQDRHPDQWLEQHYREAALVLASMQELHVRETERGRDVTDERGLGYER